MVYQSLSKKIVMVVASCAFGLSSGVFANVEGTDTQWRAEEPVKVEAIEAVKKAPVVKQDAVVKKAVVVSSVPMDSRLKYTSGDGDTSLAELVKDKKAVLLDFWATWCGPCKQLMPELEKKSQKLPEYGIEVVAVNTFENDMSKVDKFVKGKNFKFRSVTEANSGEYSKHFNITSIPRMVLLSQEGEVLFNGHPNDPGLQKALAALGARH